MSPVALRPGRKTNLITSPPSRSAASDTGVFFCVGMSEKGDPTAPVRIRNMTDFATFLGQRVAYGIGYDVAETYFREGGNDMWFQRVVGPAPVIAAKTLNDGSAAVVLNVTAENAGAWGNQLRVAVIAGVVSGVQLVITDLATGTVLDQSPDLNSKTDAVAWGVQSTWVKVIDPGTGTWPPVVVAAATMTGAGTGDELNATETQWTAALALIPGALGPGQIAMPGRTTATAYLNLAQHAKDNNRFAILDGTDTATVATMTAAAAAVRAGTNGKYAGMFAPWVTIPGLIPNTLRTVPPSALVAGLIARSDAISDPDTAPAGLNGQALFALSADFTYTDVQRDALNTGGVNIIRAMLGGIRLYGIRTLTDPVLDPNWIQFPGTRLYMAIVALGGNVLENHMFNKVDGKGKEFASLGGDLTAQLVPFYTSGALFGASPAEAFSVNVGNAVNTPTTIANGELHAQISIRVSNDAELVVLDIVRVPTNQNL